MRQVSHHPRDWRGNLYVYPVISRRSRGLSIGINLNPDTACNFDCVYCQVDRTGTPRVRAVDTDILRDELHGMISVVRDASLFKDADFADVPADWRAIKDIAFSGDGEPTTCKHFASCVEIVADAKRQLDLTDVKIVLITDACYLLKPEVEAGLAIMDRNNGEIWAKLDAGTEDYFREINRPNYPLSHVMENITAVARIRPVVIQTLFMKMRGEGPGEAELSAYIDRLREIVDAGGRVSYVQVYTIARRTTESYVTALENEEVERIGARVRDETGLPVKTFFGAPS